MAIKALKHLTYDEFLEMYRNSSDAEIAKQFGCCVNTVTSYRKKHKISPNPVSRYAYTDDFRRQAVKAYKDGKGTLVQVSEEFGITNHNVLNRWVKKYG